jgi:hypothetical protein
VELPSVETLEQVSAFAANVATAIALGVGGWWTYLRFFKNRTGKPKAALVHSVEDRRLTDDDVLVRVVIKLENTGSVLLPVERLRCEISQVHPLAPEALERLKKRELITDEHLANLCCIRCYEEDREKGEVRIEPGETDIFPFDFVVPSGISTISIYAHIGNSTERKKEIGWELTALYDLNAGVSAGVHSRSRDPLPRGDK